MTDRPDVAQILSDQLRAARVDRLTAANIVATVGAAVIAQMQWDDMERWRNEQAQNTPASPTQSTLPHEPADVDHTTADTNSAQQALQRALGMTGSRWMLMAPSTKDDMAARSAPHPYDPLSTARMSLFGVPVLLDDEMPHGAWRMLNRSGKTIARWTP